jgi:hypothetical protein
MGVGLSKTPREPQRFARWLTEQCDRLGMQDAPFRTALEHALRRANPTLSKSWSHLQRIARGQTVPRIDSAWQLGDAIRDMQRKHDVAPRLLVGGLTALVAIGAYVDFAATLGLALEGHPGDDTVLDLAHRYTSPGVVAVEPVAGPRGPVTVYPDYEACLMNPGGATRLGIPDDAAVREAFQDWFGDRRLTRVPRELRSAVLALNTKDEDAETVALIQGLEALASAVAALQWRLSGMEVVTAEQLQNEPTLTRSVVSQHARLWTQVSLDKDA